MLPSKILVIDDFLGDAARDEVWRYFRDASFTPVNSRRWNRTFRPTDGVCLESQDFRLEADDGVESAPESLAPFASTLLSNPTSRGFIDRLGVWSALSLQAYIYPAGAALSWHLDRGKLGAYIYYAHPDWSPAWGGELVIFPDSIVAPAGAGFTGARDIEPYFCGFDPRALLAAESGIVILPRPNRLVVFQGGLPHTVKRVEPAAGNAFRASVSGFISRD